MKKEWICEDVPAVTLDGKVVSTFLHRVQELVRCKDCEHYRKDGYCKYNNHVQMNKNWFCADGERKEEERDEIYL